MKVSFISPYSDISSMGIRILSACLKRAGHDTSLIFLPRLDDMLSKSSMPFNYNKNILSQVAELCEGAEFIGISLMSNYFDRGVQLTSYLKSRLDIPIIWGGVHPTVKPEDSLKYADIICIGEAEETILELVEKREAGEDITRIKGLWFKDNGQIIKAPLRPLKEDLDSLPFFDYDMENHYILREKSIEPMNPDRLSEFLSYNNLPGIKGKPCYQTITARGCPYKCSYCCNNVYRSIYKGQKYLRRRSSDNIIKELTSIIGKYNFIEAVQFSDDTIFATTEDIMEEFTMLYKKEIYLPFYCLGHPTTITEKKMRDLVDAGLKCIQIGVETGSEATKKLYMRNVSNERILKTVHIVNKFKDKIYPPIYDFIVDNPYETEEDILQTIKLILKFPQPYDLNIFSLVLFPGTELYRKAIEDGYIKDEVEQVYRKRWIDRKQDYLNILFSLLSKRYIPKSVLRILSHDRVVKIFNNQLRWLIRSLYNVRGLFKSFRVTLLKND